LTEFEIDQKLTEMRVQTSSLGSELIVAREREKNVALELSRLTKLVAKLKMEYDTYGVS
jgi:hypothetical protein